MDASGELDQGKTFNGSLALEALLKGDARVPRAVVKYLMSYALGRELDATDRCLLDEVTAAFLAADRNRMKDLVTRVASLPTMKMRRGASRSENTMNSARSFTKKLDPGWPPLVLCALGRRVSLALPYLRCVR